MTVTGKIDLLEHKLSARIRQQEAVAYLGQLALLDIELPDLMIEIVNLVARTLNVEFCKILELQPDGNSLLLKAGVGWKEGAVGRARIPTQGDSQAGYTLASRQPVIVEDLAQETRFQGPDLLLEHNVVSGMSTVIGSSEQPYGVLGAHTSHKQIFSQEDINFLQSVANILGAVIKRNQAEVSLKALNADLEKRVFERTAYVSLLHDVTMAANEALSLSDALQFSLARVARQLDWPVGHVFLVERDPDISLIPSTIWYFADPQRYVDFQHATSQVELSPGTGLPGKVYLSHQAQWGRNLTEDSPQRAERAAAAGMLACCGIPVLSGDEVVAVLEFFSEQDVPPDEHLLNVLTQLGTQLGRVVERIRSAEKIRRSENLLAQAQSLAHMGSWEWDIRADRVTWSDEMYRIYGLEPGNFANSYQGFLDHIHPDDRERIDHMVEQAFSRCEPFEYNHRIILPTGDVRYIYAQGTVLTDETGRPIKMIGTGQDITERQLMQVALQDKQEMFENLFEFDPNGLLLVDSKGKILRLNRQIEMLFGYKRGELVGKSVDALIIGNLVEWPLRSAADIQKLSQSSPQGPGLNVVGKRKDDSQFLADVTLNVIQRGDQTHLIYTIRDITEWRRAEEQLAAREKMLSMVVTSAPLIIWSANQERIITLMDGKELAPLGIDPRRLVGASLDEFIKENDKAQEYIRRAFTGEDVVTQVETPQGSTFEMRYAPLFNHREEVVGVTGIALDISQRVETEKALRASEEKYRLVIESVKNYAIFTLDPDGLVTSWNVGGETIMGYRGEEVIGRHFSLFYNPDAVEQGVPEKALEKAIAEGRYQFEGWHTRKDGEQIWVNIFITPMYTPAGELRGFSKVVRDMTERKRIEEELRESEMRFRTIFMGAGIGISLVDLDDKFAIHNPALQQMLGYSASELRRLDLLDITHPSDVAASQKLFRELLSGEREIIMRENRFICKGGDVVWANLTVSLVRDVDGKPRFTISMVENISARKQMQAELEEVKIRLIESREEERLHLAQDLHDEPLQELYGVVYQLKDLEEDVNTTNGKKTIENIDTMLIQVIETLRAICGDLRPPSLSPFGLEGAIRDHAERFSELHPEIQVKLDLMHDQQILPDGLRLGLFRIYQQAMANIIRHAHASQVKVRFRWDSEQVFLDIEDNGVGFVVPDHWVNLARQGHLGLVGAAERIELIQGQLEIVSAPGAGTLIRIIAPRNPSQRAQN
jgi:PAS domain S-box-containing protein